MVLRRPCSFTLVSSGSASGSETERRSTSSSGAMLECEIRISMPSGSRCQRKGEGVPWLGGGGHAAGVARPG